MGLVHDKALMRSL